MVAELLAPDIDFVTKGLILSLKIVKFSESNLNFVLKKFYLVLVVSHLGGGWSDSFKVLVSFLELLTELFLLITEDHKAPNFI